MKKKKKRKSKKDETTLISHRKYEPDLFAHDNEAMHETAFVRDTHVGIGGPSVEHEGRDSPDYRYHHESHAVDTDDLFESPIMFVGAPPAETMDHEHVRDSEPPATKSQQFTSALHRFLARRSVIPRPPHIEHIDVSPPPKHTDVGVKPKIAGQMYKSETDTITHTAASNILDKAWQSDRPSSPHPAPDTENVHPKGARPKIWQSSHDGHGQARAPLSTFGSRKPEPPKFATDAPTSIRGRHSPDLFKDTQATSDSPHITTKYHHEGHPGHAAEEIMIIDTSETSVSTPTFSRNIRPQGHDIVEHGHPTLFGSRERPLPLLEDDTADSSSRGSTPPEGATRPKKKSKSKVTGMQDPSLTSPWEKYKTTLPPPVGKTTKKKKSSKVKPAEAKKAGILDEMDCEEQTKL